MMSSLAFLPILIFGFVAVICVVIPIVVDFVEAPQPRPRRGKPRLVLIQGGKRLGPTAPDEGERETRMA